MPILLGPPIVAPPAEPALPPWSFGGMQAQVLGWLDDTGDQDRMRTMCRQVLNDANLARATEYPWGFMRSTATLTPLTPGSATFALPADFYRPCFAQVPGVNAWMTEVSMRGFQELGPDPPASPYDLLYGLSTPFLYDSTTVSGAPRRSLVCLRDVPASISITYYRYPVPLVADADLSALPRPHDQLLVYDAVLDLKSYAAESIELLSYWMQRRDGALRRLYESQKADQTLGAWTAFVHPSQG